MNEYSRPTGGAPSRVATLVVFLYGVAAPLDIIPLIGGRSVGSLAGVAAIAIAALSAEHYSDRSRPLRFALWSGCTLLFAVAAISSLWAPPTSSSFALTVSLAYSLASFWAVATLLPSRRRTLLHGIIVGEILLVALLFLQGDIGENLRLSYQNVDENVTAYTLAVGIAACIVAMREMWSFALFGAVSAVLSGAVLLTGSRTGVAALVLVILVAALVRVRRDRIPLDLALIASAVGVIWFLRGLALRWDGLPDRVRPLLRGDLGSDSGRSVIRNAYMERIDEWWVTGTGYYGSAHFLNTGGGGFYAFPHNTFLKLWVETGLLGVAAFGLICLTTALIAMRSPQGMRCTPLLVPGMIFSLTLGGMEQVSLFWVSVALIVAAALPPLRDSESPRSGSDPLSRRSSSTPARRVAAGSRASSGSLTL
ncbi:O-antigen ligase family protein [Brachybacterium sp. Marseille-Q7125]|uniref:O-antigen ligase family protein n=1 Tax=Brachybacterium sp. Marseille-Q7125 TaxID=2932815 RepID=UPI001FF6A251